MTNVEDTVALPLYGVHGRNNGVFFFQVCSSYASHREIVMHVTFLPRDGDADALDQALWDHSHTIAKVVLPCAKQLAAMHRLPRFPYFRQVLGEVGIHIRASPQLMLQEAMYDSRLLDLRAYVDLDPDDDDDDGGGGGGGGGGGVGGQHQVDEDQAPHQVHDDHRRRYCATTPASGASRGEDKSRESESGPAKKRRRLST